MFREFIVVSVLILFVLVGFILFAPFWSEFEDLDAAVAAFASPSPAIVALVVIALCFDFAIPVPSTVTLVLLGLWLGPVAGGLVGFAALMVSTWLGYYAGRAGRIGLDRQVPRLLGPLREASGSPLSWAIVALTRAVPMLSEVVTIHSGMTRLPARGFFLSAVAGTLPFAFLYASALAIGTQSALSFTAWALVALTPAVLVFAVTYARRGPVTG